MNVLHYAGISRNGASGVSVIVPEILNAQSETMNICFYNYGKESFSINRKVISLNNEHSDDYHTFPIPFNKPDIVVFHSPFGIKKSVKIAVMLEKEKIPYIIVPHGCFSNYALVKKRLKKMLAMRILFRRMFSNATAIQFLSAGEKNVSRYSYKGIVIPNGISIPSDFKHGISNNGIKMVFISRKDIYHKGLDLLIKACSKIKEQLMQENVTISLYGPYENNNENDVKTLIQDNNVSDIVFDCPAVFGKEKEKILLNSDIVVLTSRFEGLPGTILEAWAYGCPTLLTVGSNMAEEAEENNCGWKAQNEVEDISEKLLEICSNRQNIKEKSVAARTYVANKYNWPSIAKRYFDEYQKTIHEG